MTHAAYPLLLKPRLSRRLWGGDRLAELFDVATQSGSDPVGEAWLVYADNTIENGPLAGRTLQAVSDELGARLLGTAAVERYGTKVPLLAKLIDAAEPLSIQVHPDDAFARAEEAQSGYLGKEEAWYVLDAAPGAQIVWGFAEQVDEARVREAVAGDTLAALVRTVQIAAGDVIYNPAGKVHAIGAGIFLFEIQQSSDLTYRLYDYGRKDARGDARELHLDRALAVAELTVAGEPKVTPHVGDEGWIELVRTPYFVMEKRDVNGAFMAATSTASLEILTFVSGRGSVRSRPAHQATGGANRDVDMNAALEPDVDEAPVLDVDEAPVRDVPFAHDAVLLPAALGAYRVEGAGELIRCRLPENAHPDGSQRASSGPA